MTYVARHFDAVPIEQLVIGACLRDAPRLDAVLSKLSAGDFEEPIHQHVMQVLADLRAEGRSPSLESVLLHLGNDEVVPGLTMRGYLNRMSDAVIESSTNAWSDAVEVLFDQAQRRRLQEALTEGAAAAVSSPETVASIADRTISVLDDVIAAQRAGKTQRYDCRSAAAAAFAHLDSEDAASPTTGLADYDTVIGGWPQGQLSILAARPGMGKTAKATSAILRAAKAGHGCLFHSLEMGAQQLGARMLSDLAYTRSQPIFYEDILQRRIDERQRSRLQQAQELLSQLPVIVEEQRGVTTSEICARSRKHHARLSREGKKLAVVFVDHIGLVRPSSRYAGQRVREVAEITDALATLAKDLDVAVVGLCQLNRAVESRENRRPSLSDLRDSGSIEEDASTVTFLYRPAYYLESLRYDEPDAEAVRQQTLESCRNKLELIVAKNRNGRIGVVEAFVDIGANAIRSKSFGRPI